MRRVLYGICAVTTRRRPRRFPARSRVEVSRAFIQASGPNSLQERDLSGEDVVAIVLDGKTFAEATMVGAGHHDETNGSGFVETDTENEQVDPVLRSLVERGLDWGFW